MTEPTNSDSQPKCTDDVHDPGPPGGRRPLIVVLVVMLAVWLYLSRGGPPPEGWGDDYAVAKAAAVKADLPLVVAFHGRACPPCWSMSRTVLKDEQVLAALKGFVPVRVYLSDEPELATQCNILAAPTYVILSPAGEVLADRAGTQSVEQFIAFLEAHRVPKAGAGD